MAQFISFRGRSRVVAEEASMTLATAIIKRIEPYFGVRPGVYTLLLVEGRMPEIVVTAPCVRVLQALADPRLCVEVNPTSPEADGAVSRVANEEDAR